MYSESFSDNFGDARGIILIWFNSALLGLATVSVGIRLLSRRIQRHGFALNDYAAVLGWILTASLVITSNIGTIHSGAGRHIDTPDSTTKIPWLWKAFLAGDVVWAAANTSIKISVLHFYISIFRSNKTFLMTAYSVMVMVVLFGSTVVLSDFLACRPLSKYWDPLEPGNCDNTVMSLTAITGCNAVTDLIIVLLPMPLVWGLKMATRRKIELTIIFALGFLVCTVAIVRLVMYAQVRPDDYTRGILKVTIVTVLEPLLGVITACLPLYRPSLKKVTAYMKPPKAGTRNVLSSGMARARLNRLKTVGCRRYDDSLLQTDLEDQSTRNHVADRSDLADDPVDAYGHLVGVEIPPRASVKVERDRDGRSDGAGRS